MGPSIPESRPLLEQALALKEKTFGEEQPSVASAVNALGSVHFADAEPQRRVEIAAWLAAHE